MVRASAQNTSIVLLASLLIDFQPPLYDKGVWASG